MTPKRTQRIVIILAPALVTGGLAALAAVPWKAPEEAKALVNPRPAGPDSVAAGRRVYENKCLGCHGPTGNGDGPDVEDLGIHPARLGDPGIQSQTDGELFWKIKTGRRPMPAYGRRLATDDIWNAVHYVRSFAAGATPGK